MKVARFEFGTVDFKKWFSENREAKNIKLVGTLPLDKIKETSEMIMNTGITSIDLSECEIATCCDDDTEEQNCDYYADEILDFNGHAISPLLKMFLNKRYSTQFVIKKGVVFSKDRKVIVHQEDEKTIKIPEGVEIIGRYAFSHYEKLAHIVLPDGLKEFGDNCMESLDNLHKLEMPDSVVKLGESSFCYSELESVKVADGIEVFPACCFRYCAIDNIPKSLRVIEDDNCFWLSGQEEAAVLELPEGFESLGSYSISSYDIGTIIFPSTTNFIAKDFWYDEIVGDDGDKPKIVISKDNPFYSVDKRNNIIYKYVPNEEVQRDFSRKAIEFVVSETERKYLLDKDVVLSPLEMINLVGLSPERGNLRRVWFFNELYDTNILTKEERKKLVEEINYCKQVWYNLHFVDKHRKFKAYGVLFNCVDEKTGKSYDKEERIGDIYDHSLACMQDVENMKAFEKYDKVVCRQYYCKGKKIDEECIGYFELYEPLEAINNVFYTSMEPDRPYIDLPYPFEPGDIVKLPHYNEECVVSDIYRPTAEQIKTGFVDSYDMAVTVLPVKYAETVRECISQNKPIPEKLFEEHDHWSFLQMEMVEKFSEQK
ncbi:MAG: leucine-rich repeat domain-containing protein [Bacteroidales bacterium]|nr:leucine-rich repeat domain-containing protein [Bacteroidales bacterium]